MVTRHLIAYDDCGNTLYLSGEHVELHLVRGGRRAIGTFTKDMSGNKVYTKFLNETHLFQKSDSWGINEKVLHVLKPDIIAINYDGCQNHPPGLYWLTKAELEAEKKYLHFKQEGFELQVFIPVFSFHQPKRR